MTQIVPQYDNNYLLNQTQIPNNLLINEPPKSPQEVTLPDLYYMPDSFQKKKGFKDIVKMFDLFRIVTPWLEHPLMTLGAYIGLGLGVDAFDRSVNKEYEKSIVGKAAKLGDNIHDSKFMKSNFGKKIKDAKSFCSKKWAQLVEKSAILKAMIKTPSEPELMMPKEELKPMEDRLVNMFKELVQETNLLDSKSKPFQIGDLALDKNDVEQLKKAFNVTSLSKVSGDDLANRVMLQRLKKSEDEIAQILKAPNAKQLVSAELRKASGLTEAELMSIMDGTATNAAELAKKASFNLKDIKINKGKKLPGRVQLLTNKTSFNEIYNRLHSITNGAKTSTGKAMARFLQTAHRGFTFGGGKTGVMLFLASMIVETINNARKADPKEKVGTVAQGILSFGTWVFTFPLVLAGIHAFGGVQYAGMSEKVVTDYKNAIGEFNIKAKNGAFKSFKEYKSAKKELVKLLKKLRGRETVGDQNLITKVLRSISRFTKRDLLKIEYYRNESTAGNIIRKIPNLTKDLIYSPLRFAMFLMVGVPFVDKIIDKCIQMIFGKSYDIFKEEEKIELKKAQEDFTVKDLKNRLLEIQYNKLYYPENLSDKNENKAFEMSKLSNQQVQLNNFDELNTKKDFNIIPQDDMIKSENNISETQAETSFAVTSEESNSQESIEPLIEETFSENSINKLQNQELSLESQDNINDNFISKKATQDLDKTYNDNILITETEMNTNNDIDKIISSENLDNYTYIPSMENYIEPEIQPIKEVDNYTYIPDEKNVIAADKKKGDNYTYIPSSENKLNTTPEGGKRYIPAQTPADFVKEFDNSGHDDILRRADRAEQKAIDILAGKFNSYG